MTEQGPRDYEAAETADAESRLSPTEAAASAAREDTAKHFQQEVTAGNEAREELFWRTKFHHPGIHVISDDDYARMEAVLTNKYGQDYYKNDDIESVLYSRDKNGSALQVHRASLSNPSFETLQL